MIATKAHPYILLALGLVASLAFFSATQMTATAQSQNLPSIKPVVTPDTVVAQYTAVEGAVSVGGELRDELGAVSVGGELLIRVPYPNAKQPRRNEGVVALFQDESYRGPDGFFGDVAELDCSESLPSGRVGNKHIGFGKTCTANIPDGTTDITVAFLYDVAGYKSNNAAGTTTGWLRNFVRDNEYSPFADFECRGDTARRSYHHNWANVEVKLCSLSNENGFDGRIGYRTVGFQIKNIEKRVIRSTQVQPQPVQAQPSITRPIASNTLSVPREYISSIQTENEGVVAVLNYGSIIGKDAFYGSVAEFNCKGDTCIANIPDGTISIQAAYLYDVAGYKSNNVADTTTDWFVKFIRDNGYSPFADVTCRDGDRIDYNLQWATAKVKTCGLFFDRSGYNADDGIVFEPTNIRKRQASRAQARSYIDTINEDRSRNTRTGRNDNNGNVHQTAKQKPRVVTPPNRDVAPSVPVNFTATQVNNQIRLNWRNVPNAEQYSVSVQRFNGAWSNNNWVYTTSPKPTYFTDTLLTGETYAFSVSAENSVGNSAWSNTITKTIVAPSRTIVVPSRTIVVPSTVSPSVTSQSQNIGSPGDIDIQELIRLILQLIKELN